MSNNLQFAGKIAYKSTNTTGQQYYLTRFLPADSEQFMPAMQASSLTPSEHCIVYQNLTTEEIIVQLATLEYLMLDTSDAEIGYIILTSDLSQASSFQTELTTDGQTWQVQDTSQSPPKTYPVYYSPVGLSAPSYLMVKDAASTFATNVITPDLATIRKNKSGAGMDFRNVDLSGEDLSNIDFSGADFTNAILAGTIFDGATMTGAILIGATLTETSFDGATLDQAQFATTGQTTDVSQVKWGSLKSAQGINLSGCNAQGTQLGIPNATSAAIDCSGANLSSANFSGANLSGLNLTDAKLNGTNLGGSTCNHTVFDNAKLINLVAVCAILKNTSMQGATAHGADFTLANLSSAKLSNAQFGAKALLFPLSETFSTELDTRNGLPVPQDIMDVFQTNGFPLSDQATVTVLTEGYSWLISDGAHQFNIVNNPTATGLNVFQYGSGIVPAVFTRACLDNTTCTGANFSSVSMSGVSWQNSQADYTDLEATVLCNSLLYMSNFTQAQMFGTNLVGCVLIQANLRGATLAAQMLNNILTNLADAQLQDANFTNAKINSGILTGASVALTSGVPLFVMPQDYVSDLNSGHLTSGLQAYFQQQNYPLGSGASLIPPLNSWQIDNSMDTDPSAIKTFYIDSNLKVYNALSLNTPLFTLPDSYVSFLDNPTPLPPLIAYFKNSNNSGGYSLSTQAKISSSTSWQIANTQDAPVSLPVIYKTIAINQEQDGLHVYGSTLLWLRNFPQLTTEIAFGSTQEIQSAMDEQTTCPNGYPKNNYPSQFTWEQMMTCPTPPPPPKPPAKVSSDSRSVGTA